MLKHRIYLCGFILSLLFLSAATVNAQDEETEQITYYQMEPLDDSLFILIQEEVFIDPPDPKAEIIVDLRDQANQTVTIKGTLYPFLAFSPATRARITTYPFKINLMEKINYASIFTDVVSKINIKKLLEPPRKQQISSTLGYINPYLQLLGGDRFGLPFRRDLGISFGLGTPYSGPLETGMLELNFNLIGFRAGVFGNLSNITEIKTGSSHNNIFASAGFQVAYVIPFGNFFEIGYMKTLQDYTETELRAIMTRAVDDFTPKIMDGSYYNWEFRYPFRTLGSTRAQIYVARYLNEIHIGFKGREMTIAGSIFDFRFDAMPKTRDRYKQYVAEVMIQKLADSWGFSSFALGPSVIFTKDKNGKFTAASIMLNFRLKVGTSY